MQVKVVGMTDIISYKDKKTGEYKEFRNIYFVRKPTSRENINGLFAGAVFLISSQFSLIPLNGFDDKKDYDFVYESDGRYSYLTDIHEV